MERRQILLGSGAALATVLAGCSSDETDDGSTSNGDDDEPPAGNGPDGGDDADSTDGTKDDGKGNDEDDGKGDDKDKSDDDVPGLDEDKLTIDSGKISIADIIRSGDEITVVATTTTTDSEVLQDELESLGSDVSDAVTDPEAFTDAINTVNWVLKHDGSTIMTFYVEVQWVREYINGELSEDAFTDHILETVEQPQ